MLGIGEATPPLLNWAGGWEIAKISSL